MNVLLDPFILDKVFQFLSVFDVDRCQYVCQTWRESALRSLQKRPAIDECRSIATGQSWDIDIQDEDGKRQKEELVTENHKMNMDQIANGRKLPYVYYWFLWREPISDLLPKFKVNRIIQDFLTHNARCVPGFSLLQYNQELEREFMKEITFNHPAVLIKLEPKHIENEPMTCEIYNRTRPLEIAHKEKFSKLTRNPEISFFSYFEGFHLNRYIPEFKVTITDWSDRRSPRPKMNDPKFPVKSVLYLAASVAEFSAKITKIEKLLAKSEVKPIASGGVLKLLYDWEYHSDDEFLEDHIISTIFYVGPKSSKPKESSIITIAFAGEGVKSAAHDIFFMSNFEEKLEEFKCSLDFPTDDGRVVGFIIGQYYNDVAGIYGDSSYPLRVSSKIQALFPSIRTSTIDIEHRSHLPENSRADIILHLIRF